MATRTSPGVFWRWLRGAWLGWIALGLLLVAMTLVVKPRLGQFMDYWYSVPAEAISHQQSVALREQRQQAVWQRAWLIGAAPVVVIFLLDLLFVLLARKNDVAGDDDYNAVEYQPAGNTAGDAARNLLREAEKNLVREAEKTVIRPAAGSAAAGAANAADVTQVRQAGTQLLPDDGALTIGQGGRYRVERLLASGGMGSVHKGYDQTLQRDVAIKELDVSLAQDQEQSDRFRQEALALAGLAHPYIVPVYDLVEDNERFWIVMELLPGGDLDRRIEQNRPNVKTAVNIIRAVAEGLAFAHNKGIVHRDIKPMNILFNSDGIPKLVDFGIAKLVKSQQSVVHTREGMSLGSPTYMSPEQVKGRKDIDKRTDIYALGITFYKMLTGTVPYTGDAEEVMRQHIFEEPRPPRELNQAVSEELDAIILKMLAKNPDERYQDLGEFIAALDALKKN